VSARRPDAAAAQSPAPAPGRPRWRWRAGYVTAGLLLFLCYLRVSGTVAVTADGGNNAMQAWDMLHGNWLLRGWVLGDASYYPTELPEYALVEIFRGLGSGIVHICGALTYTLLVVLASLLAKGSRGDREGLIRALIAGGIMIAPQLGAANAGVLLLEPDHLGTAVPLLLTLLLLDRSARRWWVPAAVGLLLAWGQIADLTVLAMGVLPVVVVCGTRAYRDIVQRGEPARAHWFDLALAASAVASVGVADGVVKLIGVLGGYTVLPVSTALAPSAAWPAHVTMVADGVLRLFGAAFYLGPVGLATGLSIIHLAGVGLAVWAIARVIRHFLTWEDLIAQLLTVAIVVQVTVYALSMLPVVDYADHEIAIVLPFGAALAARVLAGRLTRARLLPVLAVLACGYLAALGYGMSQPGVPARDAALATWLSSHHLTAGLSTYGDAGSVELASHGAVMIAVPDLHSGYAGSGSMFEGTSANFDPARHYVNFAVTTRLAGSAFSIPPRSLIRVFGEPARTYHYQAWTIMTWNKNLLDDFR
jgi:hypothetical protein